MDNLDLDYLLMRVRWIGRIILIQTSVIYSLCPQANNSANSTLLRRSNSSLSFSSCFLQKQKQTFICSGIWIGASGHADLAVASLVVTTNHSSCFFHEIWESCSGAGGPDTHGSKLGSWDLWWSIFTSISDMHIYACHIFLSNHSHTRRNLCGYLSYCIWWVGRFENKDKIISMCGELCFWNAPLFTIFRL